MQDTDNNMTHAYCMLDAKVTNTQSQNVVFFHCKKYLHERGSMSCCTYIACLACNRICQEDTERAYKVSTVVLLRNHCYLVQ